MAKVYPLVSVVTATYRHFESLFETMQSVFRQDYPNIEYVICDDGSDDFPEEEIRKKIEELKCDHVKNVIILASPENRGTVRNLNHAYKQSHGDYILNLSCGDVFFADDVVRKIVRVFLKNKADVVVTSRLVYYKNYEPICLLPHYGERKILEKKYNTAEKQYKAFILSMYYNMASGSAMYYSRAIMEKLGYYDEKYRLWEDGPFLSKYLLEDKLCFAYDIVSIWYQTGGISTITETRNPIYQKDIDLFHATDRKAHTERLSASEKRMLAFSYEKSETGGSKAKKIKVALKHLPSCTKYVIYSMLRKKRRKEDRKYIDALLAEKH